MKSNVADIFPVTCKYLPEGFSCPEADQLIDTLRFLPQNSLTSPFLVDLARVEWTSHQLAREEPFFPENLANRCVNPTLELLEVKWSGLAELIAGRHVEPMRQNGFIAVFRPGESSSIQITSLSAHELLALKIAAENLDRRDVAAEGNVKVEDIDAILSAAQKQGLIICPPSRIVHPISSARPEVFTLQWHLTQKCDLHCRHCYDRSERQEMTLESATSVLDQLYTFCDSYHVDGQVSFSGGNPFLYPHFEEIYKGAAERGFMTAILGNPVPREQLEKIIQIKMPEFYQVSLEGLQAHNDYIRGTGHFDRVVKFLDLLGEMGIYRMIMLTLTSDNLRQTLPLAKLLEGKVERFTFNRLAPLGEGAALATVAPSEYPAFLQEYRDTARQHPHIGCKDNLFNILQERDGLNLTGGCTGFGCGAAFNFVSVLPDGEVHACRKFPSHIGNLYATSLTDIYNGSKARLYRRGNAACQECRIRKVCGGCPAVIHGGGGNALADLDPYCFIRNAS